MMAATAAPASHCYQLAAEKIRSDFFHFTGCAGDHLQPYPLKSHSHRLSDAPGDNYINSFGFKHAGQSSMIVQGLVGKYLFTGNLSILSFDYDKFPAGAKVRVNLSIQVRHGDFHYFLPPVIYAF
jgi:hypothetical protein